METLMEHCYFVPGLLVVLISLFLIIASVFIKTNSIVFWDYIKKAVLYAQEKSETNIVWENPYKVKDNLCLSHTDFENFMYDICNAIACFYKLNKALEIKNEIFELYKPYQEASLLDVESETDKVKKAYGILANYLEFLEEIKDHSIHHSSDFQSSDLKRYNDFSSKKWRQFIFKK